MFEKRYFIVMDSLEINLYNYNKLVREKGQKYAYTQNQMISVTRQICQGLKFMKNKGVIHCDIKPENIMFTTDKYNSVKIIDFGSSCEDYTTGFSYVQSRMYRAPEIVMGIPYDHSVDMWSVGCILFEMLNGSPLFPARDENELLEYHIVTLGDIPSDLARTGKNYKSLFKWNKE